MEVQGDVEEQDDEVDGVAAGRHKELCLRSPNPFPPIAPEGAARGSLQAETGLSQTRLRMAD